MQSNKSGPDPGGWSDAGGRVFAGLRSGSTIFNSAEGHLC